MNIIISFRFLLFILLACLPTCLNYTLAVNNIQETVQEIFIDAYGNNRFEAKIKAHEGGMRRSFMLLADKLQIPSPDIIQSLEYNKLKKIFKIANLKNELSLAERYSATVDYECNKAVFYKTLLDYGGEEIEAMFAEALVLPVFKQKSFLYLWGSENKWYNHWQSAVDLLNEHKITIPKQTLALTSQITPENVLDLQFNDFIAILKNDLFKRVIIPVAEFFTERQTGESYMKVKTYIYLPMQDHPEIIDDELPLNNMSDIAENTNIIVDRLIDDFGQFAIPIQEPEPKTEIAEQDIVKPIIMNFDAYDQKELDSVINKLEKVEKLKKFEVQHDFGTRYKIILYLTSDDEFALAESLYQNGLSYTIHGNLYNLIDVQYGG